jgi:hypothetical protein
VDTFVTRLRKLATTCEFGQLKDELILCQLVVCGCSERLRRKLLNEGQSVTLDKALQAARTLELTAAQAAEIEKRNNDEQLIAKLIKSKRKFPSNPSFVPPKDDTRTCYRCGTAGHIATACKVPRDTVCHFCNQKDHLAKACLKQQRSSGQVNAIGPEYSDRICDNEPPDKMVRYIAGYALPSDDDDDYLFQIGKSQLSCETVDLNLHKVKVILDSGASCNVISKTEFIRIGGKVESLMRVKSRIFAYGTDIPLNMLGSTEFSVYSREVHYCKVLCFFSQGVDHYRQELGRRTRHTQSGAHCLFQPERDAKSCQCSGNTASASAFDCERIQSGFHWFGQN